MSEIPRLPEHYDARQPLGMLPDDMVYPYHHAVVSDASTRFLFVNKHYKLSDTEINPDSSIYMANRIGLMRIYSVVEGELKDGFIADMRNLKPGELTPQTLTADEQQAENGSAFDKALIADQVRRQQYESLLAVLILDQDGQEVILGDQSLSEHMDRLRQRITELSADKLAPAIPEIQPDADQTELQPWQPSLWEDVTILQERQ